MEEINRMSHRRCPIDSVRPETASGSGRLSQVKKGADPGENDRQIRQACAEFEALFINMMLKELRATVQKSGFMDGGNAEELYTGLLDTQSSRDLSTKGGIGLAAMLYQQMANEGAAQRSESGEKTTASPNKKGQVHKHEPL